MTRKHNWNSFRGQRSWAKCQDHVVDINFRKVSAFAKNKICMIYI